MCGFRLPPQVQQIIRTELEEIAWNDQQAGETLAVYDIAFRDGSFWKKADASDVNKARPPIAMCQDAIASGVTGDLWIRAIVSNNAWSFGSGLRVFLASGGGAITSAPINSGDTVLVLGRAVTPTTMEFNPETSIRISE